MSLQKEFEALGCWSVDAKAPVVAACYDDRDAFMWGKELKDFAALKALRAAHADDNDFIAAVENYTLPKE